ncbi:RIC1 protein [Besnoitia besnoiti]|uniref:RIC1 protein n=1 Tax=Besnoitia besnoiti TaxID=94643 RepID=A0A2A9M691_BESBE|nr:RIC1 protein [Besnoitia besnoiti]PFH30930.1 RIC1 protein [Besnoitia besnoiti]
MQGQSGKDAAQSAGATSSVRFDLQEAAKLQWANPLGLEDARGGPLEEEDGEWEHQRVQGGVFTGVPAKAGRGTKTRIRIERLRFDFDGKLRSEVFPSQVLWTGSERESAAGGFLDVECCYALLLPIEQKPEPLLIAGVLAPLGVVVACSPSRVAVRRASLPPPTAAECAERRGRQRLRAPCINLRLQLQPSLHPLLTRLLAVSAADRSFVHAHPPLSGVAFPARRAAGPGPSVGRLSPRPASGHQSPFPSPSPVGALACGVGLRAHETAAELLFQIRASPFFTHLVELALYELFERFLSGFKRELRALAPFKASRSAQTPPANGLAQAGVAGASPQRDANGECRSGVSGVSASSTLPHQKRGSMESENVGDPTEGWAAAAGAALMRHREEGLQRREIGLQSSRFSPSACSGPCSAEQKGANRAGVYGERGSAAKAPPGGAAPQQTSRVLQRTNRGDWEDAERAREAGKEMASQRKLAASDGRELAQPGSEEAMGPRRSRDARKKDRDRDEFGKASARYEDSHGGAKQAYGIAEAERRACALFSLDRLLRAEDVSEAFSLVAPRAHPYRVPVPSQLSSGPSLSPSSGSDVPLPSSASSRSVARAGSHGALSPHPAASSPSAELSLQQRFAVAQEALTALPGGAALYLFLHLLSRHSPSTLAKTVASCVRKTEPTLAPLVLFPLLGSPPATYFEDAMKRQLLHTASIYLLVLQNTEGCLVVRQKRALPLLRAALRLGVAGLARKLVRFVLALLVAYPARKRAENSACEATGDPTEKCEGSAGVCACATGRNCEEDIVVPWSGAGGAPALWARRRCFRSEDEAGRTQRGVAQKRNLREKASSSTLKWKRRRAPKSPESEARPACGGTRGETSRRKSRRREGHLSALPRCCGNR